MNKIISPVSALLSVSAVILCFVKITLPAWVIPAVALLAWVLAFIMIKKVTAAGDVAANFFALVVLGYTLDHAAGTFPFFEIVVLLTGITYLTRPVLIKQLGYVKAPWIEPFFIVASIAAYVYVNMTVKTGWAGWAYPAPILLLAGFNTLGSVLDNVSYRKAALKEYNVDIGKPAPDFSLPDESGKDVKLSDYSGKQLVLLLFVRGDWCPSCHIMLRTYGRETEKFKTKNVLLLAICPDDIGVNREMVQKLDLDYRILSDAKQEALKLYGIQYQEKVPGTDYETGVPMPASILIDKNGIVRYISRADRAGDFLNPMQIFSVLQKLEA